MNHGSPRLTRLALLAPMILATAVAAEGLPPASSLDPPGGPQSALLPDHQLPAQEAELLLQVRRGDTLADMLGAAGIRRTEAQGALDALGTLFPARGLRPGQEIALRIDALRRNTLLAIEVEPGAGRTVIVRRGEGGGWTAEEQRAAQRRHLARIEGEIRGGLFDSLRADGLPAPLALDLVRLLSHRVDFQRDLQPGDRFAVAFERFRDESGDLLGHGRVLHAELTLSGRRVAVWRFEAEGGGGGGEDDADWYDEEGRPLRGGFLRTPLDGARISSGFGPRRHPALGFTRMHQGVDFAAPTGTPVFAAADGVVASARTERGYGRIIRLRHAGGAETLYAHLSRFARGLKEGQHVTQGEVIGAVGSTGLSTGPHLHFEIALAGRTVDPAGAEVEATERLTGPALVAFRDRRQALQRQMGALAGRTEMALAE